jgi:hypothetical protein
MAEARAQQQQTTDLVTAEDPHAYGPPWLKQPVDTPIQLYARTRAQRPNAARKA